MGQIPTALPKGPPGGDGPTVFDAPESREPNCSALEILDVNMSGHLTKLSQENCHAT